MKAYSSVVSNRIERVFAIALLVSLALVLSWFFRQGYLPQPFYYVVDGSLMDLYSPAFWAYHQGAYTLWHSLYPPLSFDFLRLFTAPGCYGVDEFAGRQCDPAAVSVLVGVFLLNALLVWLTYRRIERETALPRAIAVSLGLPMLYALERGNLLIPCFTAFVLGVGPLIRSPFWRTVALAVSVNFKPYLLAVFLPAVARRDWRWLLGFGVAGLSIYLLTFLPEGTGTPLQLLADMGRYAGVKQDALWANLYFATSYWPLARFLSAHQAFAAAVDPMITTALGLGAVVLMRLAQVGAAACMIGAIARPSGVEPRRFMALYAALILTTVTNGSSGYSQFFLFFLVFFEPWRGPVRIAILVSTYLLCLPIDWAFWPMVGGPAHSFLSGRDVSVSFGVSLGQLIRPGLLLVVQYGLVALNLQDSLKAGAARRDSSIPRASAPASVAGSSPTL